MKVTPEKLEKEIQNKKFAPVYFLYGEEPYFIDRITGLLTENVLLPEQKDFNLHTFYGKDSTISDILDIARRFPMMSDYQLVVVREAQHLDHIEHVATYAASPQPSTVLVINYKHKSPDKRKKYFVELDKHAIVMESPRIRDYKLPEWIMNLCREKEITADIKSATLLAESLGSDLEKIIRELDKLKLVLPDKDNKLTPDLIEEYVGFSKEFNHFELTNAISQNDFPRATRIILYFCKNPNAYPIQVTLGRLYFYFVKLMTYHSIKSSSQQEIARKLKVHPFFVKEYARAARFYTPARIEKVFSVLRQIDMASKGSGSLNATHCDLLKELIYKIMNP